MSSILTPNYHGIVRASAWRRMVIIDDVTKCFRYCSSKYTWGGVMVGVLCWMRCATRCVVAWYGQDNGCLLDIWEIFSPFTALFYQWSWEKQSCQIRAAHIRDVQATDLELKIYYLEGTLRIACGICVFSWALEKIEGLPYVVDDGSNLVTITTKFCSTNKD